MQPVTDRRIRLCTAAFALALGCAGALAQERVLRPAPVPSPSVAAPANLESPQLPSGPDTGIPGSGQKPALTGNVKGDNTPRKQAAQRRATDPGASSVRVDDRAAARAAGRASAPAASAAR